MTQTLTDVELDVVFFIERFVASGGVAPTRNQIEQRFNLPDEFFESFNSNQLIQKSFRARGIVYPAMEDKLTDSQMHAIAVMLDVYDRRSDEKKLRDIGVTTRQWSTWMLEESFASYVKDRSERMLEGSVFEAHKGLVKGARNGNVAAAKALYEITGRFRPDQEQQIDIRRVLHTMIEVLQRYIKDPVILQRIAMDLSAITDAESYSNGLANQMSANPRAFQTKTIPSFSIEAGE